MTPLDRVPGETADWRERLGVSTEAVWVEVGIRVTVWKGEPADSVGETVGIVECVRAERKPEREGSRRVVEWVVRGREAVCVGVVKSVVIDGVCVVAGDVERFGICVAEGASLVDESGVCVGEVAVLIDASGKTLEVLATNGVMNGEPVEASAVVASPGLTVSVTSTLGVTTTNAVVGVVVGVVVIPPEFVVVGAIIPVKMVGVASLVPGKIVFVVTAGATTPGPNDDIGTNRKVGVVVADAMTLPFVSVETPELALMELQLALEDAEGKLETLCPSAPHQQSRTTAKDWPLTPSKSANKGNIVRSNIVVFVLTVGGEVCPCRHLIFWASLLHDEAVQWFQNKLFFHSWSGLGANFAGTCATAPPHSIANQRAGLNRHRGG